MERLTQNNFDYCLEMCEPETQLDCAFYMGQMECVCGEASIYNKLREYEDAEQEGRLVVLPCKVGDTIYILRGDVKNGYETVKKTHVEEVPFGLGCLDKQMKLYPFYYLTRAEAEKAMEVSG